MDLSTAALVGLLIVVAIVFRIRHRSGRPIESENGHNSAPQRIDEKDPYECIEPLHNFEWAATAPIKQRPFKPKYHLTMGTENLPLSELIAMDNTYLDRLRIRKDIMRNHLNSTVQCNPTAEPAVRELYTWLIGTYLPKRFPRTFQLSPDFLYNTATHTSIPLHPGPGSPIDALRTLGANIDTDFLILLPGPSPTPPKDKDQPAHIYHLQAFVTCFPSGFSTLSKLGLPLAAIHGPVPGYQAKLAKSMDRFFARMPAGRAVRRANWTVTTSHQLFCEAGNHLHDDAREEGAKDGGVGTAGVKSPAAMEEEIRRQKDAVRVEDCWLRSERQTLHRLPVSGAIVFAFKTYMYALDEVKAEGNGEALAEAIEGLRKGSVPEFEVYKRGVVWGEKVIEFLRS